MSSPKRIVMLTRVLPHHSFGGMQAVAWDLARAFAEAGNIVTVITAEIPGFPAMFSDSGVEIKALPGTSWRYYGPRWWRATRRVFNESLGNECDAVISVSAAAIGLLKLRSQFPKVRFLMQAHGTSIGEIRSKWRSWHLRAWLSSVRNLGWLLKDLDSYRRFDAVVAVGAAVTRELASVPIRWFLNAHRVHTISNGIDTSKFQPNSAQRAAVRAELGWTDDGLVVISASRLHRQKGNHLALAAFSVLVKLEREAKFIIVGDGPEFDALKTQALELGVAGNVHFTGAIAREDLPRFLQAADVMLFTTTRVEGLPLNVLEALATGIPAVVSRHLFENHELKESSHLHLVEQSDARSVAESIIRAAQLSPAGDGVLPEEFALHTCVKRYIKLIDGVSAEISESARAC